MSAAFPFLIVDYGHGGLIEAVYQTAGKRFAFLRDDHVRVVYEGVQSRIIAAELIRLALETHDRVYDCTAGRWWTTAPHWTELEQRDISLRARIHNANQPSVRKGLLVSLHSNATGTVHQGEGTTASGWELYTSKGVTASDAAAAHFGSYLESQGETLRGLFDQGFAMVAQTRGTAMLVEHGFHTTWADAERILDGPSGIAALYWGALKGLLP
jgi:N-acetylmuramoyl-L-alanine amidase